MLNKRSSSAIFAAYKPRVYQRGAALVTTLLIVALITVTVTAMTTKQHRAIQLAQNRQSQLQLRNLAGAGERFAMAVLRRDKKEAERGNSDSTEDYWAQSLPPVPVDGATIEGCVIDLQGKFNLNNLQETGDGDTAVSDPEEFKILERLLTALTIDSTKAEAIKDWIDKDIDVTGANGAEDDFYTGQAPAYRAANGPMVSPSELLLVKGFRVIDEGGLDDYDVLLPHITTLPTSGSSININTASSAVLASLSPHMAAIADDIKVVDDGYWESYPGCPEGGGLLDSLLNADEEDDGAASTEDSSEENPEDESAGGYVYEAIAEFQSEVRLDEEEQNLDTANIDISSRYFLARVTVKREDITLTQYTIFERGPSGAIQTHRRSRGSL